MGFLWNRGRGGEDEIFDWDLWHIATSTLLAIIATLFIIIERARFTFRQIRRDYVMQLKQNKGGATVVSPLPTIRSVQHQQHGAKSHPNAKKKGWKRRKQIINESTVNAACNHFGAEVNKVENDNDDEPFIIGFFHPHCSAGGGGERVLWKFIQVLGELREEGKRHQGNSTTMELDSLMPHQQHHYLRRRSKIKKENLATSSPIVVDTDTIRGNEEKEKKEDRIIRKKCRNLNVVVYTVDEPTDNYRTDILENVRQRFSIIISPSLPIQFVHLHEVKYFLDKPKRLSMIFESWGTIQLAWCALNVINPHVYIDTTGCAFTFLVAKLFAGCRIGTYVHYPTISSDMLSLVWERRSTYNNPAPIAANPFVSYVKLLYYSFFALGYGLVGSLADLTMVNSTWTKGHIESMWKLSSGKVHHVLFPPVDTKSLIDLSLHPRENIILSIGQFRPEKDHALQLRAFAKLLYLHNGVMKTMNGGIKLVLIGSCRGQDDERRVSELHQLAKELHIQDHIEFVINQPHSVLKSYFRRASVGIHTMWNEHFGIGIVEMMAAGLVTVAHNSGGPKSDIILRPWNSCAEDTTSSATTSVYYSRSRVVEPYPTGCLASTEDEYASAMCEIFTSAPNDILHIRECGRDCTDRFSDEEFAHSLKKILLSSSLFRGR